MKISNNRNKDKVKLDKSQKILGDKEPVKVQQEILSSNTENSEALHYIESIIASIREPIIILDKDLNVKSANQYFYKTFLVNKKETKGHNIFELSNGQWATPELKDPLEKVLTKKTKVTNLEVRGDFKNLGQRVMLINANEILNKSTTEKLILLAIEDVTERRQLENKEIELNEIFMNMVVHAPVAMIVLREPNHLIDIINEPALRLMGKTAEIIKKPLLEALPKIKKSGYLSILDKVYSTGKRFVATEQKVNMHHLGKGTVRYLNLVFDPFKSSAGSITGVVAICNDVTAQVTARKKIEEDEKKFHLIADFMPEKVWTADEAGNKNYFNKRYLTYTGLSLEELKNWGWKSVIHPDDWPENEKLWKIAISTGNDFEYMHRIKNAQGEYLWHLSRSSALKDEDGVVTKWVGTKTEIHSVKEEEEKRADFIQMVSHELKTPVTSIKGYVQLLQLVMKQNSEVEYPETLVSSLHRIDNLVDRLTRLIKEMLDLSRLDSGRMEFHEDSFNLLNLIEDVVKDTQQTNRMHTIKIVEKYDCIIKGDKNQLEQLMVNLLGNAIKYSKDGTEILVSVIKKSGKKVAVSIKDEGIGICPIDQEKIFERFYRVSGKDEKTYPGFGIGLFICKEIVERHGGSISLESEKNKGSTFIFTLPCK